jgi:hypothetical protein
MIPHMGTTSRVAASVAPCLRRADACLVPRRRAVAVLVVAVVAVAVLLAAVLVYERRKYRQVNGVV